MSIEPPVSKPAAHIHWMLLAAILAGAVPLLARPTAELGFSDDCAYARMAFEVARSGRFHYDGWVSAAIGPQAYWGALFVRMFGPSYFSLRCSVLLLAAGSGALLYHIARLCGLAPGNSLLASVAVMLSPLSIVLSASFMTDIPGFFLAMLSIACCVRAICGRTAAGRTAAFVAAMVAALAGGWIRQVIWVMLLCVIPITIWLARIGRHWLIIWMLCWALALAAMVASIVWLGHAPYKIQEDLGGSLLTPLRSPVTSAVRGMRILMTCVLLAIPMIPAVWPAIRKLGPLAWVTAGAIALILFGGTVAAKGWERALDPWLGNNLTRYGCIEPGSDLVGGKPSLIPPAINSGVALLAWIFLSILLVLLARHIRTLGKSLLARQKQMPALYLLLALSVAVLTLCLVRAMVFMAFDRYVLPALPLLVILLLKLRETSVGSRPSVGSWLLVCLFAAVGIAFVFESQETARARLAAIKTLEAAHVPRTQVCAGVEFDVLTQLSEWGYMNYSGIKVPSDAYVPLEENPDWRGERSWYWLYAPAIMPQYVLTRSSVKGYEDAGLGQLSYRSLFPPFRRPLYILKLIDPTQRPLRAIPGTKVRRDRVIRAADVSASEAK